MFAVRDLLFPLTAGGHITEIVLIDVNGDGDLDLLLAGQLLPLQDRTIPIQVLLGDGNGGFTPSPAAISGAPAVTMVTDAVLADLNGDGRPDVFLADYGYDATPFPGFRNTLILSGPSGYSNASANIPIFADLTHSISAADIDRDGDIDAYVGNHGGIRGPYFLINDGTGRFAVENRSPQTSDLATGNFTSSAFLDANGDGYADLFLGTTGNPSWDGRQPIVASKLMLNDRSGHFVESGWSIPSFGERANVVEAITLDLNRDGREDLIVSLALDNYNGGGTLKVLVNTGSSFVDETADRLGVLRTEGTTFVSEIVAVDLNGDGYIDLIPSVGFTNANAPILLNDGSGHFVQMPGLLPDLGQFSRLAAGDVNNDGRPDLLTWFPTSAERTQQDIRVYLNTTPPTSQNGGNGNDALMGRGAEANILHGMEGADTVVGGSASDFLRGEEGNDILFGGAEFDDLHGNQGNDTIRGGIGDDWVVGGKDEDMLFGDDGWDIVLGNLGNDTLYGGAGTDVVRGGQGNDVLFGGDGDDLIFGDRADDTVTGGTGADTFFFHAEAGRDRILDFNFAEGDRIKIEFGSYTVAIVGSDIVFDFGGGNQLIVVGQLDYLPGWLV